jgi:hypothetical protein
MKKKTPDENLLIGVLKERACDVLCKRGLRNQSHSSQAAAVCPPSTLKSVPVMKLLPLESKNTAGALKSSGAPSLPSRAPAIHVFSTSGSAASRASVIAVRMYCDDFVSLDYKECGTDGRCLRLEIEC